MQTPQFDVAIVGGGIVGLATAWQLGNARPELRIVILEKETRVAEHQTGHNSGVLHSGIYYKPGSLKAINCRDGKRAMEQFCRANEIPFDICGKVIVAVNESEIPALERIYQRGQANGVLCSLISRESLNELEPNATGIRAIHVPEAGIVDYRQVCEHLAKLIRDRGQTVQTSARVTVIRNSGNVSLVKTPKFEALVKLVVNCGGLQSDRLTAMAGDMPPAKIIPFRGEYFELKPEAEHFCRNLIYPVPDPNFPFLGVHFTRMIHGGVECGPNAVLALAREGYSKLSVNPRDLVESLTYIGFLRLAARHWRMGINEIWRSMNKSAFVRALQRLVPAIRASHLESAPSGVRAQAVMPDGSLVDDFLIVESSTAIHVNNAPSPAATASLNIGKLISDKIAARFTK